MHRCCKFCAKAAERRGFGRAERYYHIFGCPGFAEAIIVQIELYLCYRVAFHVGKLRVSLGAAANWVYASLLGVETDNYPSAYTVDSDGKLVASPARVMVLVPASPRSMVAVALNLPSAWQRYQQRRLPAENHLHLWPAGRIRSLGKPGGTGAFGNVFFNVRHGSLGSAEHFVF